MTKAPGNKFGKTSQVYHPKKKLIMPVKNSIKQRAYKKMQCYTGGVGKAKSTI